MKLYLISQDEAQGYETYDAAVVAAPDAETARLIRPDSTSWENSRRWGVWAHAPENVNARLIGDAVPGTPQGVILASYNAG